jgi:hypothetical protein
MRCRLNWYIRLIGGYSFTANDKERSMRCSTCIDLARKNEEALKRKSICDDQRDRTSQPAISDENHAAPSPKAILCNISKTLASRKEYSPRSGRKGFQPWQMSALGHKPTYAVQYVMSVVCPQ